jgi:hypothetical protein
VLLVLMRPRGTLLWQPAKSPSFAARPPGQFAGRGTFHGSVPQAGPQRYRPPGPRDAGG